MPQTPFNKYRLPPWLRRSRDVVYQFILPLIGFQLLRLLLFPTTLDVIILVVLVSLYLGFYFKWI